ncbi:MAG: endonuclease/exonuclease/phosphatase family protein [Phycisphaerae bacterium]
MRLRVVSYNIHKAVGTDRKFDVDRIVEVLRHHDADVVLLQEVDRHAGRSNHLELAAVIGRRLDYPYRSIGINHANRAGKYGNATLSRFPIGHQKNIDLTVGWRKRRGAQFTRLHLPRGGPVAVVDVFNIHLGLAARIQRVQVARLLDDELVSADQPNRAVIVAGDTNDWAGLLHGSFRRNGFQCASTRRLGVAWAIRTFPSFAPAGGLDKIFYRGPLTLLSSHRSRLKLARVASDHLPIVADFEVSRTPSPLVALSEA